MSAPLRHLGTEASIVSYERATTTDIRENDSQGLRRDDVFVSNSTTGNLGFKVIFDMGRGVLEAAEV